jgi:antitoxin (DNA-binding transcriptional repressor) of toxin-antitoxin stability system
MSVATLQQFGQSLPSWLALVRRGETVAIVDGGHEVARLVPPVTHSDAASHSARPAADDSWVKSRLAELEEIFPEPVVGASEELEAFRAERF